MSYDFTLLSLLDRATHDSSIVDRLYRDEEVFNIFKKLDLNLDNTLRRKDHLDMYYNSLHEGINSKEITYLHELDKLKKTSSWVYNSIKNLTSHLESFEENIISKTLLIREIAQKNNIVDNNLENYLIKIKNYINNENNRENIKKIVDKTKFLENIIQEYEITVDNIIKKINIEKENSLTPYTYEKNISKNPNFEKFLEFQLKYRNQINSFIEGNYIDAKCLIESKDEVRNNLKEIYKIFLNNKVFLSVQDEKLYEFNKNGAPIQEGKSEKDCNPFGLTNYYKVNNIHSKDFLLKRNNEIISIYDKKEAREIMMSETKDIVRNLFHKNPTITKFFINKVDALFELNGISGSAIKHYISVISNYLDNKKILDNYGFNVFKEFDNIFNSNLKSYYSGVLEEFEDKTKKIIKDHNVKNYAKSISSNKYDHLFNERSYEIIAEIYDLKLEKDSFQKYIGKKIAKYKSAEEFNNGLDIFLKSFNSFTNESIKNKANDCGVDIIYEDKSNNTIILKINNFEQCTKLGSSSWCISTNENYFNSYVKDGSEQYIVYNFDLDQTNPESQIGMTMNKKGEFSTGYYKDDSEIEAETQYLSFCIEKIKSHMKNKMKETNKNKANIF